MCAFSILLSNSTIAAYVCMLKNALLSLVCVYRTPCHEESAGDMLLLFGVASMSETPTNIRWQLRSTESTYL